MNLLPHPNRTDITDAERVAQLLDRLEKEPRAFRRIVVKSDGETLFFKSEEIDWIAAEGDYMKFHAGGRAYLMRETMARLVERLDQRHFVRIHRSTIVNIERVRKLKSTGGDCSVVLHDGTTLKLSRGYQEDLSARLTQVH